MPIQIFSLSETNDSSSLDSLEQLLQLLGQRDYAVAGTAGELFAGTADRAACDGLVVVGSYEDNPPFIAGAGGADTDADADPMGATEDASAGVAESVAKLVVELLQSTELPVLAIGFGFELLCVGCGIDLGKYGGRGPGAKKLEPTTEGVKLFQGSDPLRVKATERWQTDEFPKKLQVLARSSTGVEAVKHKTRPLYGLQLRPEDFTYPSDAKMVYENIFLAFDQYNAKRA